MGSRRGAEEALLWLVGGVETAVEWSHSMTDSPVLTMPAACAGVCDGAKAEAMGDVCSKMVTLMETCL